MKIILLITLVLSPLSWGQEMNGMSNKDKFQYAFQKLTKDSLHIVDEFYAKDVEFHDPVGTIKGSDNIKKYYENMYKNVKSIKFDFSEFVENGDTVVGVWVMTMETDKLNDGEPIKVDGTSVVKFKDGKAVYHRDYFDMGAFIYEHVPFVGFMVRKVKDRLKAHDE